MNRRMNLTIVGALILGIIVGVTISQFLDDDNSAKPYIVEGYCTCVNADGTAIGVSSEKGGAGEGYVIAGAMWRDANNAWTAWTSGLPTCLEPLTSGKRVRLAVIDAEPTESGIGRPVVVWFECLD